MVYLNKGIRMSREKDLEIAEKVINEQVQAGWVLQEIASPADGVGAMIGVFYREY